MRRAKSPITHAQDNCSFLGSYIGIGVGDRAAIEHEDIELTALKPGEVLVVVCSHGHADAVRDAMQRHQGVIRLVKGSRV